MAKQTYHFKQQLLDRVGLEWDQLIEQYDHEVVSAGESTPHRIVRKKQARYPDQDFIVFKDLNLFCARGSNEVLVTAMYLDGKWGYSKESYCPKKHYGNS